MFAISFGFISVAAGIFGTYDEMLRDGGPLGICLWPIVAVGPGLVALVIAQFAARIALTGSSSSGPRGSPTRGSAGDSVGSPSDGWGSRAVVAADNALVPPEPCVLLKLAFRLIG